MNKKFRMPTKTRNNGIYTVGIYKPFLYPKNIKAIKPVKKHKRINQKKILSFANQLRYLVLRQLKPGSKLTKSGKIVLTSDVSIFLKTKYNINSRFKSCINILEDNDIEKIRIFNEHDYCEIISFYARIHQPGKLLISGKQIFSAPYFSFQYLKKNDVL